jgi:hypothetical protein
LVAISYSKKMKTNSKLTDGGMGWLQNNVRGKRKKGSLGELPTTTSKPPNLASSTMKQYRAIF